MKITGLEQLTDFNRILRAAVKRGSVLVCYLDGLGWYGYEAAIKAQAMPYVREHFFVNPIETVSPPLTNPAMATMLTGVQPKVHGVTSRKQHRSQVPTLFKDIPDGVIIEGDSVIIQTEVPQNLHTEAEDGNMDYSVFRDGLSHVPDKPSLLFLHFHGIDDAGHSFGPYAPETMEKIKEIDSYIEQLAKNWPGEVLLISDHGLHEKSEAESEGTKMTAHGDHGEDTKEDRTIIFGWQDPCLSGVPGKIPVSHLIQLLSLEGTITQLIFTGEDGYATACGAGELEPEVHAQLLLSKGETPEKDTWRLAFPSEPIARRWCKDVVQVDVRVKR